MEAADALSGALLDVHRHGRGVSAVRRGEPGPSRSRCGCRVAPGAVAVFHERLLPAVLVVLLVPAALVGIPTRDPGADAELVDVALAPRPVPHLLARVRERPSAQHRARRLLSPERDPDLF